MYEQEMYPLPSFEAVLKMCNVRYITWTFCSEHPDEILTYNGVQQACTKCKDDTKTVPITGYFVYEPFMRTGVFSTKKGELKDMLLSYATAKRAKHHDLVIFAGSRGFKIKTVRE